MTAVTHIQKPHTDTIVPELSLCMKKNNSELEGFGLINNNISGFILVCSYLGLFQKHPRYFPPLFGSVFSGFLSGSHLG